MRRIAVTSSYLLGTLISMAQAQSIPPALQELIQAEINFSDDAQNSSLKEAFMKNLLPDAVTFQQGVIEKWSNAMNKWPDGPDTGKVVWYPIYADIASTNDLGYTTGPLKIYKQKTDSVPVNVLVYNTVWKKQVDGQWKAIADLGSGRYDANQIPSGPAVPQLNTFPQRKRKIVNALEIQKKTEEEYNAELNGSKRSFLSSYLSNECRLHHPFQQPVIGKKEASQLVEAGLEYSEFEVNGSGISASGDFAYSYGILKYHMTGNNPRTLNLCYLRVWKIEGGNNWKVVLDVIG